MVLINSCPYVLGPSHVVVSSFVLLSHFIYTKCSEAVNMIAFYASENLTCTGKNKPSSFKDSNSRSHLQLLFLFCSIALNGETNMHPFIDLLF